jgi:septum site-determining protein MinD
MVTSGKGGTGKTSLTAGVASCLAALGHRVLCIDLDIGLRNLDIALGMTDRALMDFTDVMDRRCSLLTGAVEQPDIRGLFLLTAPVRAEGLDTARFRQVVREACDLFDFVFLDSPAGLGEGFQLATAAADRAVVVSATEPAALRDAQRAVQELVTLVPTQHLVMNRVEPKLMNRLRTTIDEAMDTAGLPLIGVVPEDKQVILTANQGRPLILSGRRGAANAYLNIAKRLEGQRVPIMRIR